MCCFGSGNIKQKWNCCMTTNMALVQEFQALLLLMLLLWSMFSTVRATGNTRTCGQDAHTHSKKILGYHAKYSHTWSFVQFGKDFTLSSPDSGSYQLHGWCTHYFSGLDLHFFQEQCMELAGSRHGDCICLFDY